MGDPMVHVLQMSDGASTVLRPWPEREPGSSAVIDCGAYRASQQTAAERLWEALGRTFSNVGEFVITHFDLDHWGGLERLHTVPGVTADLPSATLYVPAMPRAVPQLLYALTSSSPGPGLLAIRVKSALEALLSAGSRVTVDALTEGRQVSLAGDSFDVLWPPRQIDRQLSRQIHGAITAIDQLAKDLAEEGHPELRDQIEEVLRTGIEESDLIEPQLAAIDEDETRDDEWLDDSADTIDPPDALKIPEAFHERYAAAVSRIRAANNNLSLVLASKSGSLVCFGDIGGPALRSVLASNTFSKYRVALMPHHGTRMLPIGMPVAHWCVSQDGPQHHGRNLKNHYHPDNPPGSGRCWSTHVHGEFRNR